MYTELFSLKLANTFTGCAVILGVIAKNPLATVVTILVGLSAFALNLYKMYEIKQNLNRKNTKDGPVN